MLRAGAGELQAFNRVILLAVVAGDAGMHATF